MQTVKKLLSNITDINMASSVLLVLSSLVFVPYIGIANLAIQHIVAYIFVGFAMILAIRAIFNEENSILSLPKSWAFFVPMLLVLIGFLSAVLNPGFLQAVVNHGVDNLSLISLAVMAFAFYVAYFTLRQNSFGKLALVLQVIFIVNLVVWIAEVFTPLNFVNSTSGAIVPEVTDFAALSLITLIISMMVMSANSAKRFVFNVANVILSTLVLVVLNIFNIWMLALIAFLFMFKLSDISRKPVLKYTTIALTVLSLAFLLFGSQIQRYTTQVTKVNFAIIKPSLTASNIVMQNAYNSSLKYKLIGSGPASFSSVWDRFKPAQIINNTPYWNTSFTYGYSTLMTSFVTFGIVGGILLLILLIHPLLGVVRFMLKEEVVAQEHTEGAKDTNVKNTLILSVILSAMLAFSNPGLFTLALWATIVAYAMKLTAVNGASRLIKFNTQTTKMFKRLSVLVMAVLSITMLVYGTSALASTAISRSTYLNLLQGNTDKAEKYLTLLKYSAIERDTYATMVGLVVKSKNTLLLQELAGARQDKDEEKVKSLTENIKQNVDKIMNAAISGVRFNPNDYKNHIAFASAYSDMFTLTQDEEFYKKATEALNKAAALAPGNPLIPFNMAQLALLKQDVKSAKTALGYAINLKPDYDPAYGGLTDIALAQKSNQEALNIAQAAVQNNPRSASAWLRLAYLLYSSKDYKNAAAAFENSIALSQRPDANTLYILALSYDANGDYDKALNILNALNQTLKDPKLAKLIQQVESKKEKAAKEEKKDSKTDESDQN